MWWYHEAENWISYVWIAASVGAWVLCYARGHRIAAWVAPLTISAFCLGLYLGIDKTAKGTFRLPTYVVAQQMGRVLEDYCCDEDASSEVCAELRDLMKPRAKPSQ
jgi:hypothetical protein